MAETVILTTQDGKTIEHTPPTIPARTSTKALVGGTFLSQIYVQLVSLIPHAGVVMALTTPEMTALVAVVLAALVARFTKSPIVPSRI